ncbi:Type I restriction-modification system, DNA-methyltransferase subunit M [Psychrobacter nivimaris]|uniref:site-specific DNA-methyltransferase (adenine-specific) n=1 Tax=Psychrobacter nivimaris TaxID=281738 RepID=A0A6N7BTZ9_9GAMM|nr:type I restriction-modification system subunit M [Psychrobacter nivimaris]KAF0567529.1 Type I restriction-modification system, DNA-methyltransferase subunit M [Psychrobacter nivimaris]|tara:strand:- start:3993 stop:5543 length:1551 start_codon:yes stop_codon:yes gene_type:complete
MPASQINQDDINKAVWNACDTFRGVISADTYKDFILTMLFLKYLSDVYRDEYNKLVEQFGGSGNENPELIHAMMSKQRFVLPEGASFWDLYEQRHQPGNGQRIDEALHAIEEANGTKLKNVFQDISFNTDKLGQEKQKNELLRHLLEDFGKDILNLSVERVGSLDVIGNAYEFLIKHFAASSGATAGEFYTPPEVSNLLATILEPVEGDEICDPACGSGSLLIKCGAMVRKNSSSKKYALYGQEAIGSTWALAKMNMFLHGEDNHRIEWGDTIRNPLLLGSDGKHLLRFDVVTANPPFSLDKWGHEDASSDPYGRFHRGVPPKTKGDYAFISHMIETLKPATGRMGVVVPHGVLFRASSEGKIRQQLIEENLLDTVIGLPEKLFFGTGIPAAILLFKKNKTDPVSGKVDDSVLFIDASNEFKSGKNQNQLTPENINKIIETYKARESVDKYAYLASFDEIKENDFNLNIPRYVDTFEEEAEIDLDAVRTERLELKAELESLETEMAEFLKELGYGA